MDVDPILWNWSLNEVGGYIVGFILYFAFGVYLSLRRKPRWYTRLLLLGLAVKAFMSWAYIALFTSVYGGGDFDNYMMEGYELYKSFMTEGWSAYVRSNLPWNEAYVGTRFVEYVSSIVGVPVIFSMHGLALIFTLFGFVGQILFVESFANAFPIDKIKRYAWIIILAPSLSFWASSVGKDSMLLLGLGLTFYGLSLQVVKDKERRFGKLLWVVLGIALVFFVRPQVAALVGLSIGISFWLSSDRRWTPARAGQALLILGAAIWVAAAGLQAVGIESLDSEGVTAYVEHKAYYSGRDATQSGVRMQTAGNPIEAMVNVLFRPFIWEAGSPPMAIAAFEVLALWGFVLYRLKTVALFVRQNRRSRVFVAAMAFILFYSIGFGMSVSNLGIIARQRIHVVPMLVMLVSATPRRRVVVQRALRPQALPFSA